MTSICDLSTERLHRGRASRRAHPRDHCSSARHIAPRSHDHRVPEGGDPLDRGADLGRRHDEGVILDARARSSTSQWARRWRH